MSKVKKEKIEFQLTNIEILESQLKVLKVPLPSNVIFSFDISIEQRFNIEQELIFVILNTTLFPQGKPEQKLGKFSSSCIFKINDLSEYVNNQKEINLPHEIITTINSISISTTRGLMFSFFKGTFLHGAILPLVDPSQYKMEKR